MSATSKQKKKRRFDQSAYAKAVVLFYGAVQYVHDRSVEKYCHLTRWQPKGYVKCAYLVPKSLAQTSLRISSAFIKLFYLSLVMVCLLFLTPVKHFSNSDIKELRLIVSLKAA